MIFLKDHNLINNKITYGVESKNIQNAYDLDIKNIILDYDYSMASIDSLKLNLVKNNFSYEDN